MLAAARGLEVPGLERLAQASPRRYSLHFGFLASQLEEVPVQLKLSTRIVDGVLIVDCSGRIIFGEESAALRDTIRNLIADNHRIVLNLSGVNYIDSGGLGTLVALYTTAQNTNGSIKLSNLTQRVGDLLLVTKLLTVFEVYDEEQKAVQSFREGAAA